MFHKRRNMIRKSSLESFKDFMRDVRYEPDELKTTRKRYKVTTDKQVQRRRNKRNKSRRK